MNHMRELEQSEQAFVAIGNWLNNVSAVLIAYIAVNAATQAAKRSLTVFDLIKGNKGSATTLAVLLLGSIALGMVYLLKIGLRGRAGDRRPGGVARYIFASSEGWTLLLQGLLLLVAMVYVQISPENIMAPRFLMYKSEPKGSKAIPEVRQVIDPSKAIQGVEERIEKVVDVLERLRGDLGKADYRRELIVIQKQLQGMKESMEEIRKDVADSRLFLIGRVEMSVKTVENVMRSIEVAVRSIGTVPDYREQLKSIGEKVEAVKRETEKLRTAVEGARLERSAIRER